MVSKISSSVAYKCSGSGSGQGIELWSMLPKTEFCGESASWITNQINNLVFFGYKVSVQQYCTSHLFWKTKSSCRWHFIILIGWQSCLLLNWYFKAKNTKLWAFKINKCWFELVFNSWSTFSTKLGFRWHALKFYSLAREEVWG